LFPLGFASFFCFGLVLVLLGANQAGFERDLGLDLAETGLLAAMLALGLLIGVVGAGPLFDRFPRRPLFVVAAATAGAALLAIGPGTSFAGTCVLIAMIGIGTGAYDTLFNASVVEHYGERAAKPMSIMHSATTVGAVLCPVLAAAIATRWHWTRSFHVVGAAHLFLVIAAFRVHFPPPKRELPGHVSGSVTQKSLFSARLLPFAVVVFAYVGLEGALTVFAVPYSTDGLGLSTLRGQTAISAFWFGLLLGRLGPLLLPGGLGARALIAAGLIGAVSIAVGVSLGGGNIELIFGGFGVATGCVYPIAISLVGQQFPRSRGTAAGLTAGAGAIGGFAIPWLTGVVGDDFGITAAIGSLTLWSVLIAIGGFAAKRIEPTRE
jgi:MFS family permease